MANRLGFAFKGLKDGKLGHVRAVKYQGSINTVQLAGGESATQEGNPPPVDVSAEPVSFLSRVGTSVVKMMLVMSSFASTARPPARSAIMCQCDPALLR